MIYQEVKRIIDECYARARSIIKQYDDVLRACADLLLEKEKISTFDDAKQISGTAECGTAISIKVYTVTSKGKLLEKESYEIEVGKSGIFSQNVELRLGENLVELTALQQGKEETVQEITVNRKKSSIKRKLQSEMYLPGSGI